MPKTFDFSENYFVPIHRFTFDHSISFKKLLKRKGNSITQAKTNVSISQTSSERLKLTKEKFTLHEVNSGGAAKMSTIFYQ